MKKHGVSYFLIALALVMFFRPNTFREVPPPIIRDFHDFKNEWYSKELNALGEVALHDSDIQVYRLTQLGGRITTVVRIEINADGTAEVFYKIRGEDTLHTALSEGETQEFLAMVSDIDFWGLPTEIDRLGFGGFSIVFEGVNNGEYHIVDRWVPDNCDPVRHLADYILDLVRLTE
jgi:hypothetical protein